MSAPLIVVAPPLYYNAENKTKAYEAYAAPATSLFIAEARNERGSTGFTLH